MPQVIKNELYLSGGGDENQSFPLDSFFLEKIPLNGSFLYVPIALRGHKLYETAALWMKKILTLHNREDISFKMWDSLPSKTYSSVACFDAIYIGGGNTWSLMSEIKAANFQEVILKFIEEKGPVYGGSAGGIIMGKRINTHEDKNTIEWTDMIGFGMIYEYSIACHFKEEQTDKFQQWSVSHNLPILCLPEETGLIVNEVGMRSVGTRPCSIFQPNGARTLLDNGESLEFVKK